MTAAVATASVVGGPISPGEVLARAQFWTTSPPPTGYDQGGSTPDPAGKFYRSDCSGFVSMCWHLAGSETSASIPGFTQMIDPGSLQAGDVMCASSALNGGSGHVVLFDHWVDGHNSYFAHEFGQGLSPAHHVIPYPYFPSDSRVYRPYHYPNLTGTFVPAPYPPGPGGGGDPGDPGDPGSVIIGIPTYTVYDMPGDYTWVKPATGTWAKVWAIAGGGFGGSSGLFWYYRDSPVPVGVPGGGGGGAGQYVISTGPMDGLPDTVQVHVGHGGGQEVYSGQYVLTGEVSTFGRFVTAFPGTSGEPSFAGAFSTPGGAGVCSGGTYTDVEGVSGWIGSGWAGESGEPGWPDGRGGIGGSPGSLGLDLPAGIDISRGGGGMGAAVQGWTHEVFEAFNVAGEVGIPGALVVETGGDRHIPGGPPGPDLRPPAGDYGNTPAPPPPPEEIPRYLRMSQRNDRLGIARHPRLTGTGSNNPTSAQLGKPRRLGTGTNTYL